MTYKEMAERRRQLSQFLFAIQAKGVTGRAMAFIAGVTPQAISQCMGESSTLKADRVIRLAQEYQMDLTQYPLLTQAPRVPQEQT